MGMQPQEDFKRTNQDLTNSINGFVEGILNDAKGSVFDVFGSIKKNVNKNSDSENSLNMNREMIRQLIAREDISNMLDMHNKNWKLSLMETVFALTASSAVVFMSMFRRPILGIMLFLVFTFIVLCVNQVKSVNYHKKFEKKLREIAGSDAHMKVLEDMLRNTPYSTKSGNADGWIYKEMLNFRERDKEFAVKKDIEQKSDTLKIDLLRNINKD